MTPDETHPMTTMDRIRVHAAVSDKIVIDSVTARHLCALADDGLRAFNLERKAKELADLRARLERDQKDFTFVRLMAVACFALSILSALGKLFLN